MVHLGIVVCFQCNPARIVCNPNGYDVLGGVTICSRSRCFYRETEVQWWRKTVMKHVGRILTAVLVVFALAVVWYARSGEAVVTRRVFTNAASIVEGTIWVRSDKGLLGGPVPALPTSLLMGRSSTPARV